MAEGDWEGKYNPSDHRTVGPHRAWSNSGEWCYPDMLCSGCRDEWVGTDGAIEVLCEVMHDAYEAAAVKTGWETQERSRAAWADVPEANKETMRAAVVALLERLGLR